METGEGRVGRDDGILGQPDLDRSEHLLIDRPVLDDHFDRDVGFGKHACTQGDAKDGPPCDLRRRLRRRLDPGRIPSADRDGVPC